MAATGAEPLPVVPIVCAALIDGDNRILLQRRPPGKAMAGLWEFPGGKIAFGESPEAALCRELKEELDLEVATTGLSPLAFASHRYEKFHILLLLYVCRVWSGAPIAREGQALAWVTPRQLHDYQMPPADEPLVERLQALG